MCSHELAIMPPSEPAQADALGGVPAPHSTHRAGRSEYRAFVLGAEQCAALLIAELRSEAYLRCCGVCPGSRIVRVPYASAELASRGGEPRQARVAEALQAEARQIRAAALAPVVGIAAADGATGAADDAGAATLVVWRCFGAGMGEG